MQQYLYYQLQAAITERNICTIVQNDKPIPEGQLRPLTSLPPEVQAGFDTYEHGKWEVAQQVWGGDGLSALREDERCAKSVKSAIRMADLSYSHHLQIADLAPDKQRQWLEKAASKHSQLENR